MAAPQQYFEVLGLSAPPEDRKTVKRAYSRLLKVTRPEDDPEGFMRLRDAHDQALNILKWKSEEREQQTVQSPVTPLSEPESETAQPTLTYSDMLPEPEPDTSYSRGPTPNLEAPPRQPNGDMFPHAEPESETSYSRGPSQSLDAPVIQPDFSEPPSKLLIEKLEAMLKSPKRYNEREQWNILFREARQLDIDEYVDFENALLESILHFHGFYKFLPLHNTPEKMPLKLSPSIASSLFKTLRWDQVNMRDDFRVGKINWLERRMQLRKRGVDPSPIPQNTSSGNGNVWLWIFGAFIILKIIQVLVNL